MSRRYTVARTINTRDGMETFTAEQFDSFDEALKAVDKGVYDRKLELEKKYGIQNIPTGSNIGGIPSGATLRGPTPDSNKDRTTE